MKLIRSLFSSAAAPIGVDLGSASLKLAQVALDDGSPRLVGLAAVPIPANLPADPQSRINFFSAAVPEAMRKGGFRGKAAVLGLPAAWMHLDRIRLPETDERAIAEAVKWETVDRFPFHASQALLRHWVAGQVFEEDRPHSEVIVMAARRPVMDQLLAAGAKARLDIMGVQPEPLAVLACLSAGDGASKRTQAIVDIGRSGTRVYVVRGQHVQFARAVDLGGVRFDQAVAEALNVPAGQAVALRAALQDSKQGDEKVLRAECACRQVLHRLLDELDLCFRYHAVTFIGQEIEQIIVTGGDPASQWLCREMSSALGLPVRPADPLAEMDTDDCAPPAGSDSCSAPGAWTIAIGLSLSGSKSAVLRAG
jgi:type IV pilus assembly protein PilM